MNFPMKNSTVVSVMVKHKLMVKEKEGVSS
jgi:hypothetical protein